jgi:two-component system, cell cycle sensor histidine kinase and response regulator CckA
MKLTRLSEASEQARVAQLFNHVRDAVIMLDPTGVVGFWSRGASQIYGRQPVETLNTCYLQLIPPRCRAAQAKPIHQALEGDESSAQWQTTGPDGEPMWLEGDFRPVHDANGKRLGCAIILHDVTKWRAAEARYRLLTENATDVIARLDPNGTIRFVSLAVQSLFGTAPESCQGRHLRDFLPEDDAPRMIEMLDRIAQGKITSAISHRWRSASGEYIWCESTMRAVCNANASLAEIVMVTRSIEERRRLEAKVQNSQKLEAVGRLAGGVAHDFNNLLTVINGFSEMVLRGLANPDPSRLTAQVKEIRKAGERASALTRQLLAFGRQQTQTRTQVNLNDVVGEVRKLIGRVLGEDIVISTELASVLRPILADVGLIEQVLMNLVLNARDAMPEGGTLTLRTANAQFDAAPEEDVKPGEYVMLSVGDTGIGMDEKTRARIFEPFFTTKELGKGTGLGLASVYGIVKQTGGHIEVESELDLGTTFRIYLPSGALAAQGFERHPGSVQLVGRETILVVEDDESVRHVTGAMLRALGYRVIEAATGLEALRQCRQHTGPIHVLLTDVVMPMMNGREVAERVQAMLPGIRTLYMSGYTDDSILRHGIVDNGIAFLSKPLSHESLGRKLRELLNSPVPGPASIG